MCTIESDSRTTPADVLQQKFEAAPFYLSAATAIVIVLIGGTISICGAVVENGSMVEGGLFGIGCGLIWYAGCVFTYWQTTRFYEARYAPDTRKGKE